MPPIPGTSAAAVAVEPERSEPGCWAGAPSAVVADGVTWLAYRTRDVSREAARTVIARSEDGERFETVSVLDREQFGAYSMERPALVAAPDGRWRVYVCSMTPNTKHWWIDLLEAAAPAELERAEPRTVFPGDELTGVKDPVVRFAGGRWHAWICCHPLDEPDEEDRMTSAYDGRATKEENWFERTGLARHTGHGRLEQIGDAPVSDARYLDVLPLPGGGYRLYYEWPLPDESHELRTELVPPQS